MTFGAIDNSDVSSIEFLTQGRLTTKPSSFLNEFAGGGVDMDLSMMQDFDFDRYLSIARCKTYPQVNFHSFLQNSDSGPSGSLGAFPVFESDDNVDVGGE